MEHDTACMCEGCLRAHIALRLDVQFRLLRDAAVAAAEVVDRARRDHEDARPGAKFAAQYAYAAAIESGS